MRSRSLQQPSSLCPVAVCRVTSCLILLRKIAESQREIARFGALEANLTMASRAQAAEAAAREAEADRAIAEAAWKVRYHCANARVGHCH